MQICSQISKLSSLDFRPPLGHIQQKTDNKKKIKNLQFLLKKQFFSHLKSTAILKTYEKSFLIFSKFKALISIENQKNNEKILFELN
jgi:hypothetical protein